ncbi:Di-copper centre-containing protein [Lindgomyces ingoldianus]|uniref:Di-copper centre-containing protein n=1 Tax=Lindgomyces ingoldianus TaxID=673940 RepID=A0ACB6R138_9PLEO|nr:Di-copper centre-containing protein [Lindgomyces ingoldianus]KAF2472963.1 Di-copper centre-containing protein [Lindgomyces ingoldianus]
MVSYMKGYELEPIESDRGFSSSCTRDKLIIRREYGNLTTEERAEYVKAVQCIISKPSKFSAGQVPGAKNRYDDFVAVHLQQTLNIHGTANFLSWHRYFTWAYENALRTECGYEGSQPYWNWGKYADLLQSPIFDGTNTSMGGNGDYVAHGGHAAGQANVMVPAGKGGGCISTGPFKNMTVNLGPMSIAIDVKIPTNPQSDGLGYNPRCIRRDITDYFTKSYLRTKDVQALITQPTTILAFQDQMQTDTASKFGVHSAGHFSIWGDPGGDFFISPGDPAFFLHHGMIDRAWWIWQNQDPSKRVMTVGGSTSMFGGSTGTLNDKVDLSVVGSGLAIKELVSTTAGPFCYAYQ